MQPFRLVFLVAILNLCFVKAEVEDVERRSVDRHRRQSAEDKPSWSYDGPLDGQQFWEDIGYPDCGGKAQSPIYFERRRPEPTSKIPIPRFRFDFLDFEFENMRLTNTGRTLKLELPDDNVNDDNFYPFIQGGGLGPGTFYFQQVIFHFGESNTMGSEHVLYPRNGDVVPQPTALEMQMMFKNENGTIAVIAQVYQVQERGNYEFKPILDAIPKVKYQGESTVISEGITLETLFYDRFGYGFYFRYNGSLTYPPCTEGVIWTIYNIYGNLPIVSHEQMKQFRTLMSTKRGDRDPRPLAGNFRRLQKPNGRKYYEQLKTQTSYRR